MPRDIMLKLIDRDPTQPRRHFDPNSIEELAQSMSENGLIVPILLRPSDSEIDRYIIVHGERRYRAAQKLGWKFIKAEVRDLSVEEASWLALVENLQRQSLTPIEEATFYQSKLTQGITQAELGKRIGKNQSHIATKLRFLRLPEIVQAELEAGNIAEGHAKQLLRLDDREVVIELCKRCIQSDMSVTKLKDEVSQAETMLRAKADIAVNKQVNDEVLIEAFGGINKSNGLCWMPEYFTRCPDRQAGVFASLMYCFSDRDSAFDPYQSVASYGFNDSQRDSFKMAANAMMRPIVPLAEADLVFVNIPSETDINEFRAIRDSLFSTVKSDALMAFRVGAEKRTVSPNCPCLLTFFSKNEGDKTFYMGKIIINILPEPSAIEAEELGRLASWHGRFIDNFEEWIPVSMSRDIIWKLWNSKIDYPESQNIDLEREPVALSAR